MKLSVLFIPFDAAIQHFGRNAKNGVVGYSMQKDVVGQTQQWKMEEEEVEPSGSAFELRPEKKLGLDSATATSKLQGWLESVIKHTCDQILGESSMEYPLPYQTMSQEQQKKYQNKMVSRQVTLYPDVLFLSEEPGEVAFPDTITLKVGQSNQVTYYRIGVAGSLPVQRIYGYVRGGTGHIWKAEALVKKNALFNVQENVLVIRCELYGSKCCLAGVHLTSKNVGASPEKSEKIIEELKTFCATQHTPIQFVLGDFNIDPRAGTAIGNVGALPSTTTYMAQQSHATMGVNYMEQYSNSTNTKHFMGHLVVDSHVSLGGKMGLSLQRSLGGEFFSDHPPIYVELDVP
jgi:hypothetical protein